MTPKSDSEGVRPAVPGDAEPIWAIRNHPAVRQMSGTSDAIPIDGHVTWFQRRYFEEPTPHRCFVLEIGDRLAGYCRLDWDESVGAYVVSIAVATEFQGRGLGAGLLGRALELFLSGRERMPAVIARIRTGNCASVSIFEKHHFKATGASCYRYQPPEPQPVVRRA